jgi:hypothetical protein
VGGGKVPHCPSDANCRHVAAHRRSLDFVLTLQLPPISSPRSLLLRILVSLPASGSRTRGQTRHDGECTDGGERDGPRQMVREGRGSRRMGVVGGEMSNRYRALSQTREMGLSHSQDVREWMWSMSRRKARGRSRLMQDRRGYEECRNNANHISPCVMLNRRILLNQQPRKPVTVSACASRVDTSPQSQALEDGHPRQLPSESDIVGVARLRKREDVGREGARGQR